MFDLVETGKKKKLRKKKKNLKWIRMGRGAAATTDAHTITWTVN